MHNCGLNTCIGLAYCGFLARLFVVSSLLPLIGLAYCGLLAWLIVAYWSGLLTWLICLVLCCFLIRLTAASLLPLIGLAYCGLLA
jgi:predicted PurR-regulated permease PerM